MYIFRHVANCLSKSKKHLGNSSGLFLGLLIACSIVMPSIAYGSPNDGFNLILGASKDSQSVPVAQGGDYDPVRTNLAFTAMDVIGAKGVRYFLSYARWLQDPSGYLAHLDEVLSIAASHGSHLTLVAFDGVGVEPELAGFDAWKKSPGTAGVEDPLQWPSILDFVSDIVSHINSSTIRTQGDIMIDVMNEPVENTSHVDFVRMVASYIKSLDSTMKVIVGWALPEGNLHTCDLTDFSVAHSYIGAIREAAVVYLRRLVNVCAGKDVMINEAGYPGVGQAYMSVAQDFDHARQVIAAENGGVDHLVGMQLYMGIAEWYFHRGAPKTNPYAESTGIFATVVTGTAPGGFGFYTRDSGGGAGFIAYLGEADQPLKQFVLSSGVTVNTPASEIPYMPVNSGYYWGSQQTEQLIASWNTNMSGFLNASNAAFYDKVLFWYFFAAGQAGFASLNELAVAFSHESQFLANVQAGDFAAAEQSLHSLVLTAQSVQAAIPN